MEKKRNNALEKAENATVSAKRRIKEHKRQMQEEGQKKKGVGGWITAVVTLGIATLVLASALTFTYLTPSKNDNLLEASYQKNFYQTVSHASNIDANLSKILASNDSVAVQKYLLDTAINSELAENSLQSLPLKDQSKFYTTKLVNQIGDYSKSLFNKLADGQNLTDSDRENLYELYKENQNFLLALNQVIKNMGKDYSFSAQANSKSDIVTKGFDRLENLSAQYPELIYDGPFSDGQDNREILGLTGKEIDDNTAREIFSNLFKDYKVTDVENAGKTNGIIECYNVKGKIKGLTVYAQISKKGGKVITFDCAGDCTDSLIEQDMAIDNAKEFLQKLDINNTIPVWINLSNNVYVINFAYQNQGVIFYPDLVKVRVCAKTGMVIGLEAKTYYTNHVEREAGQPSISESTAKEKLLADINVDGVRLAVIPVGLKGEKLCYEFIGNLGEQTYYIYIDATTGRQIQMFMVVESGNQGDSKLI